MSTTTTRSLDVSVDVTNPGQFFACCGLMELASRIEPGASCRFASGRFIIDFGPPLEQLVQNLRTVRLTRLDPEDMTASPILVEEPFDLRLDWWKSDDRNITALKLWAGRMDSTRIARAMQNALRGPEFDSGELFDVRLVAYDPSDGKKAEPFYFDARRGPNAHSRDVGFSLDALEMITTASPAVELLCLIGLQRCRPVPVVNQPRILDYHTWSLPLPPLLLPVAIAGYLPDPQARGYRFESWFRTSQRKHKAFLTAQPKLKSVQP